MKKNVTVQTPPKITHQGYQKNKALVQNIKGLSGMENVPNRTIESKYIEIVFIRIILLLGQYLHFPLLKFGICLQGTTHQQVLTKNELKINYFKNIRNLICYINIAVLYSLECYTWCYHKLW